MKRFKNSSNPEPKQSVKWKLKRRYCCLGKWSNSKNSRGKKYKGGIIVAKRFLKERIYELFKEGKKRKEIASILKISRTTVCNYLNNTAEFQVFLYQFYALFRWVCVFLLGLFHTYVSRL